MKDEQGKSGANAVSDGTAGQEAAATTAASPKASRVEQVGVEWILMLGAAPAGSEHQQVNRVCEETIMVDSGCARSVCPPSFAGPLTETAEKYVLTTAGGKTMRHHGSTIVPFDS